MSQLRTRLFTPAFNGLLAALVLLLGLTAWLAGNASQALQREAETRKATIAAMSLAEVVGGLVTTGPADDPQRFGSAVYLWRQGDAAVKNVRVVAREGGRLMLTSDRADVLRGELPRRLVREEKALFDLTNALVGNIDSNAAESLSRLPELDIAQTPDGMMRVTAPVYSKGSYWGVVQIDRAMEPAGAMGATFIALLAVALALTVMAGAALLLPRVGMPYHITRWVLVVLGTVLLAGTAQMTYRVQTNALELAAMAQGDALATGMAALKQKSQDVANIAGARLSGVSWDTDQFRRPLPRTGPFPTLSTTPVDELGERLRVSAVVAWLVFLVVALGGARAFAETIRENRAAYLYILPAMAGMIFLVFFPFTYGVVLSFTDRTLVNQSVPLTELWVGFENYIRILADTEVFRRTAEGLAINYDSFYWTLFITIVWTVTNVAIGVTIGLALALVLNTEGLRGRAIYRVLLILPWAIPNYITALIWKGMFHQQFGVINQVIMMFGGEPIAWFDGVFTSFMTGVATNGWLSFPFMMVISLGALAAIPQDMYEAAKLDGASRRQQFFHITLPLLKPALIPAIILSVVWTFNMFNVIYLVSGGEPGGANEILITKAYKIAFERYQYAYAAAYSMVIFMILLAYGLFQNKATKATEAVA